VRAQWTVNGVRRDFDLDPGRLLAETLRDECGLASVTLGCSDGTCGACTVLVDGEAIRSCLMLSVQGAGDHVRTVEGLPVDHPLRAVISRAGRGR
jgi:carbon-monoxide dehydrogenase small subunit